MKYIYSVVETDNYGGDYPNESFLVRHIEKEYAEQIANLMYKAVGRGQECSRFWKVVKDTYEQPYELKPGFEP